MLLNCDLGESFGAWQMGCDELVMAHIDQANVACGFHAGDPSVMHNTIELANQHGVSIGAHPAYPDFSGFGRRSMACSAEQIRQFVLYQISALDGMARSQGSRVEYVKPHGALYNDMQHNELVREAIFAAVADYHQPLKLMLLAQMDRKAVEALADRYQIELYFEAFADRCYDDDGTLLSRQQPNAVHDQQRTLKQVKQLCEQGSVTTVSGKTLMLNADTLCVHGDNPQAVGIIEQIRQVVNQCS